MKYEETFDLLLGMDKLMQMDFMRSQLKEFGFRPSDLSKNSSYIITAYTKPDSQYSVVEIVSKDDELKTTFCVLDTEELEQMKDMCFRNDLRAKVGCKKEPRIRVTGMYNGEHVSGADVYGKVCTKEEGQVIDHKFHNTMINTREALRACTVKENNMNRKQCKNASNPVYAYKPEEDFSKTWFVYIYWRVFGVISQEEAFAYNLKKNSETKEGN